MTASDYVVTSVQVEPRFLECQLCGEAIDTRKERQPDGSWKLLDPWTLVADEIDDDDFKQIGRALTNQRWYHNDCLGVREVQQRRHAE